MPKHFSIHSERSGVTTGVLALSVGARQLRITPLDGATALYRAEFTDLIPAVSDHAGTITVDYPRRHRPGARPARRCPPHRRILRR